MKIVLRVLLAAAIVAAFTSLAVSGPAARAAALPRGILVDVSQVTVKVVGVNQAERTIALEMPSGKTRTFKVGKDVGDLSRLKKGDLIKTTVMDSVAVYIQKKGGRPSATETETVMLSPKGQKPGMVLANTIRISGKIQNVDLSNRMVTITGPNNKSRTLKVGPNVKNLSSLKAGDDVVLRLTEALAINITKPRK